MKSSTPIRLRDRNFGSIAKDISEAKDLRTALKLAGADYKVGRTKLYARVSGLESSVLVPGTQTALVEIPDARGMWKLGEGDKPTNFLGTVGTKYVPVQNEEAFKIAEVFSGLGAEFEKSYVSTDFAQICLRMKVLEGDILGDKNVGYTTLVNTHDGTSSFLLLDGGFRFSCNNEWAGLLAKSTRTIRARHTSGVSQLEQKVRASVNAIREAFEGVKALAEKTVNIHLTEARFTGLVEALLPFADDATDRQKAIVDEQRSTLYKCYRAEDLANFSRSGWAALQAVADFSSHLGDSVRTSSNTDTIVKNLLGRTQEAPLVAKARELILALN